MQRIRAQIADLVVAAGHPRVLDLPAGRGELTQMLRDRGVEVVAADLCPEAFAAPGPPCVKADLHAKLPFDDGGFDAMVCVEGIEHIENPHLLAREANRVLRLGGKIYISTPNVLSIRSRMSYLLRGYPNQFEWMIENYPLNKAEQPAHINPVGFLELRYTLSRWGFQVNLVTASRLFKRMSPLYRLLRLMMMTKGRKAAAGNPRIAAVRQMLLSDSILFGENLIVAATKIARYDGTE